MKNRDGNEGIQLIGVGVKFLEFEQCPLGQRKAEGPGRAAGVWRQSQTENQDQIYWSESDSHIFGLPKNTKMSVTRCGCGATRNFIIVGVRF